MWFRQTANLNNDLSQIKNFEADHFQPSSTPSVEIDARRDDLVEAVNYVLENGRSVQTRRSRTFAPSHTAETSRPISKTG